MQGKGLDSFGRMCMKCFKCQSTKRTSKNEVGNDFAELQCLGRKMMFFSFRVFEVQANCVLHCDRFVYLYIMDTKSASQ